MFSVAVAVLPVPWCQWRRCAPCCTLYTTSPHEISTNFILDRIPADDGAHSPFVPTPMLRSAEEERLHVAAGADPRHRHDDKAASGRHSLPVLRGLGLPHGGFHSSRRTTTVEDLHSSTRISVESH